MGAPRATLRPDASSHCTARGLLDPTQLERTASAERISRVSWRRPHSIASGLARAARMGERSYDVAQLWVRGAFLAGGRAGRVGALGLIVAHGGAVKARFLDETCMWLRAV